VNDEVIIIEKFTNLPTEKQNVIINAALDCFAANGYKKASVNDIAQAAGISKAMVFHYFGTKKKLYLFLINVCTKTILSEITEKFDSRVTDFFDRIMQATEIKVSAMKKHPAILSFLYSAYFESDSEVKAEIQKLFTSKEGEIFRNDLIFGGVDASKFKDGVDPQLVMKMLIWFSYGYMNMAQSKAAIDIDEMYKDFEKSIRMLRSNLYKPEYR
jgi:AcrR family transcriptional regulator